MSPKKFSGSFADWLAQQTPRFDSEILKDFSATALWNLENQKLKQARRPVDPLRAAIRKARREYALKNKVS